MKRLLTLLAVLLALFSLAGCDEMQQEQESAATGKVTAKHSKVSTDADGYTVEQKNVDKRLTADNEPGAIKHLYLISPYTGDVLLYSAVKGKVTSGGKRLVPKTEAISYYNGSTNSTYTAEVMNEDGTYGSSGEYIYWWDVYGTYHQEMTGAAIIHISSKPLRTKKAVINIAPAE